MPTGARRSGSAKIFLERFGSSVSVSGSACESSGVTEGSAKRRLPSWRRYIPSTSPGAMSQRLLKFEAAAGE